MFTCYDREFTDCNIYEDIFKQLVTFSECKHKVKKTQHVSRVTVLLILSRRKHIALESDCCSLGYNGWCPALSLSPTDDPNPFWDYCSSLSMCPLLPMKAFSYPLCHMVQTNFAWPVLGEDLALAG